jgi:hypothetical protein
MTIIVFILFLPFVFLFMAINIVLGCYIAIRFGYGPPNWQKALNLIVPLTTLQDCLNDGRDWLEAKAPWADRLLDRFDAPRPIIFVDVTAPEEEAEKEEEPTEDATAPQKEEAPTEDATSPKEEATGEPSKTGDAVAALTAKPADAPVAGPAVSASAAAPAAT